MTTYRTGNPIGSADPRDLYDNAENLDELVNSQDKTEHPDRLGVSRKTWHGMEQEHDADQTRRESEFVDAQADKQQRFNLLLANSGYEYLADYAAGIEITEYNQVLRDPAGELWRAAATTTLPYTTDGTGLPEGGAFVAVGDADIRNDLAAGVGAGKGGLLVRGAVIYVDTIADLQALDTSGLVDGQHAKTKEGDYYWDSGLSDWLPSPIVDSLLNQRTKGILVTGSTSGESVVTGAGYNRISNINSASVLLGGQVTQPNAIGKAVHIAYFVGDGVQDTFVVDLPFAFELTPWTNLRANLIRDTGLFQQSYTIGSGVTVTGVGTNQVSVKMPIVVQPGWELEITVYSNEDAGNATLQLVGGYDNVSAAIANVIWSHHSIAPAGAGHNTLMGGSYLRSWGSYNFIGGGTNNRVGEPGISPIGSFVTGRGNRVNGSAAAAWGENCKAHGNFSTAFGREAYSEAPYSVAFGRKPKTSCPGEVAIGCAAADDSQPGLRQNSKVLCSIDTSDATTTFLRLANSSFTWPLPEKFAGVARVKVVALSDDGVAAAFEGTFLVTKDAAGTALVDGLGTDVVIPQLSGPSGWVAHFRATAGNIGVRGTGEAGKNIRWTADVDMTSSTWA